MLEGLKVTKKEREAIHRGFYRVQELCRHDYRCERFARDEKRGYGNVHARVPEIAALALCCKWFLQGIEKPDVLFRDVFDMHPAAVFFWGHGARVARDEPDTTAILAAKTAFDAAFNRMQESRT